MQDADKADLIGILTWDLMHLKKNGFSFAPNGGGLTGLVDPATFFHPIYREDGERELGLEKTLEKIVATQYVEVLQIIAYPQATSSGTTISGEPA